MRPERILADLRAGGERARATRERLAGSEAGAGAEGHDAHAVERAEVAAALVATLRPNDHAIARWLLEREVDAKAAAGHGSSEALYALVAAVARFADPDDAILLWRAREATPETRAGVDVEQLARAGVERVRARLAALARAGGERGIEAARALAWLEAGVAGGALEALADYFMWSDERFGLAAEGPV
ncbi:MAG TPA: hypothetical protein VIC85_15660 [Ktedonobacterales bacterium]|jgi:hypothetical protein